MSLVDRTNESIPLSIHGGEPIVVDTDFDSSLTPPQRVHVFGNPDDQDFGFNLTYEEAGLLHDRLGLILGRPTVERAGEVALVTFPDVKLKVLGEMSRWEAKA